jgi:hypothetical protein
MYGRMYEYICVGYMKLCTGMYVINVLGPTQLPIQWVPGALSPGVKRLGREADHSPPTSAEVNKNVYLYIHSPMRLHGVVLN